MVDPYKVDPSLPQEPGLETFDPFEEYTFTASAAFYSGACEPTINVNCWCF